MCNAQKNAELMNAFGLCQWPNTFINVIPHTRHERFTDARSFLEFVAEQEHFYFDWELYLLFEESRHKGQTTSPVAVVYATCVGRAYNRKVS